MRFGGVAVPQLKCLRLPQLPQFCCGVCCKRRSYVGVFAKNATRLRVKCHTVAEVAVRQNRVHFKHFADAMKVYFGLALHTPPIHRQGLFQVAMPVFLFRSSMHDVRYWRTDYRNSRCVIYASKSLLRDKVRVKVCVSD